MDASLLLEYLDRLMPFDVQEERDISGIVVRGKNEIGKICICLEVESVLEKIEKEHPDAVICHHPPHYGKAKYPLLKDFLSEFAVQERWIIACHTNADFCANGFVDDLCRKIGVTNLRPIVPRGVGRRLKVIIFVPEEYTSSILERMSKVGGGKIGFYDTCSFRVSGKGTFFATEAAYPKIGQKGKLESISEVRLEFEIAEDLLDRVITEVLEVHPYEEPVIEVYPFRRYPKGCGLGRVGNVLGSTNVSEFFTSVKEVFDSTRLLHKAKEEAKSIAVCPGSGAKIIEILKHSEVDVFITSDVGYHDLQTAIKKEISVIELNHDQAEEVFVDWLSEKLTKLTEKKGVKVVRLYK